MPRLHLPQPLLATFALALVSCAAAARSDDKSGWRALPLIKDGKVDPAWVQVGWGGFEVEDNTLRTAPDARGLGMLLYKKEKFGDCELRVVFKTKDGRSNSGVFVRIDDGILKHANEKALPATRNENGTLSEEGARAMQESSEKELGPWYAVHHGFEVQIAGGGDEWHRTGSIYSLAKATAPENPASEWRTMLITLKGTTVTVDLDGQRVTTFDSEAKDLPPRKVWHEPNRAHKRPTKGYIGLQNHDPGDVVWFREVGVRPLAEK